MRSLFRSTSLHRLFVAIALVAAVPLAAATRAAIPAHGVAHGSTVHLAAPAAASTRTTASAPASFFFTPNSQWSTQAQNTRLSAISTMAASGFLDIEAGTQPATANTTFTPNVLCSIPVGASPFSTPSSGSMSNASTWSCTASATNTASFAVLYKSGHTSGDIIWMGSVGTSGANLNLATTAISSGVTISIASGGFSINDQASISGL